MLSIRILIGSLVFVEYLIHIYHNDLKKQQQQQQQQQTKKKGVLEKHLKCS